MAVKLENICRGIGKLYARISTDEARAYESLASRSYTAEGGELPSAILETPEGPVLTVPLINVDQIVSIMFKDAEGKIVAWDTCRIGAPWANFAATKNRLIHEAAINRIRNTDQHPLVDRAFVEVDGVTTCTEADGMMPCNLVHGTVSAIVPAQGDAAKTPVEVMALDSQGKPLLDRDDWTCLRDTCKPTREDPDTLLRQIGFTVKVPADLSGLVIWARFKDEGAGAPTADGFVGLESAALRGWENGWREGTLPANVDPRYGEWFEDHRATERDCELQRRTSFDIEPLFSIIVPLFNTDRGFFKEMVDSVLAQTYGLFELVLVNASPENEPLRREVERRVARDARIRVVTLDENKGISLNTNAGIAAASGDFLCFLDHDDVLEPDALYEYARGINEYPETDLLYSDEDKLTAAGSFADPYFKSDWNPDLLCGMNYVCHFLAVRASVVAQIELAGPEHDGAQDYHMTFAVGERARNVYHARRVLYHWRIHDRSTALDPDEKPYAKNAALLCVEQHLQRCGIEAAARESERVYRRFEVDYPVTRGSAKAPLVSIIVPNKDGVGLLSRCLESIAEKSTYSDYEIIVVENNSVEERTFDYYKEACARWERVKVVAFEGAFNFSAVVNFGAQNAAGDFFLFLNNDTEVITPNWIELLLGLCQRDGTGVAGAKLLFPNDTVQHGGVVVGGEGPGHLGYQLPRTAPGYYECLRLTTDVSAVTGACLMTRRDVFEDLDGFDKDFAVAFNDIDYCLRVREKGLLVVFEPRAELYHYESITRGYDALSRNVTRFSGEKGLFMYRWPRYFPKGDPFFNPNFAPGSPYHRLG